MKWSLPVIDLLKWLDGPQTVGNYAGMVTGIADLRKASKGQLTFLAGRKYAKYLGETQASVVILPEDVSGEPAPDQLWIRSANPTLALADVCRQLERKLVPVPKGGIHSLAAVSASAQVDASATIGPGCVIDEGACIGPNVVLESHVKVGREVVIGENSILYHGTYVGWGCQIGKNCQIFSGVGIGADGFGYHSDKSGHQRLPQIGIVVIEDNVDIGANTTIDRARFAETRIGEGTKIDNLVQIGHNVIIGKHCIICAQVGIAGSTEFGNFVVLAGQVGVDGHLKISDGVTATGQTGLTKDMGPGIVLSGTPSRLHREELRRQAQINQLPVLIKRIKTLEERLVKD